MTRRAPDVRRVNMLSEYRNPDEHGTTGFFRALSEADDFIREHDRVAELSCRVDELTQLVDDIKALHRPQSDGIGLSVCVWCKVLSPCPTMKLIEGKR